MFSYFDQLNIVKQLRLKEGQHLTTDCPFCGGHKKFTVSHFLDGTILWNCFKASCTAKGKYNAERSIEAAKNYISGNALKTNKRRYAAIPAITSHPKNNTSAIEYLRSVNSLAAMEEGLIKIRYAPKENRVLFYNRAETGAVGRLLDGNGPKWISYGDLTTGIQIGNSDIAIVVEDAASACSIARIQKYTGVALLGTTIPSALKNALQMYHKIYIVLDNDAARKASTLTRQIRGNVTLRVTENDLKVLTKDQIEALINNNKVVSGSEENQWLESNIEV